MSTSRYALHAPILMRTLAFTPRTAGKAFLDLDHDAREVVSVYLALDFVQRLRNKTLQAVEGCYWLPCSDCEELVGYLNAFMLFNSVVPQQLSKETLSSLVTDAVDGAPDIFIPCFGNEYEWIATLFAPLPPLPNADVYRPVVVDDGERRTCLHFMYRVSSDFDRIGDVGTVAHPIAEAGLLSGLKFLHWIGADLGLRNHAGISPSMMAVTKGHLHCLSYLKEVNALQRHVPSHDGWTLAFMAAFYGHVDCLVFLRNIDNIHRSDARGMSPLYVAAGNGHTACVEYLIQQRVDLERVDHDQRTPLHAAALAGYPDTMRLLLAAGARHDAVEKFEWTPAYLAASKGHVVCLRVLHEYGVDLTAPVKRARSTPLHAAAGGGHVEAVSFLMSVGADVHAVDALGRTPLAIAEKRDHLDCVAVLSQ